jgi:hypothetical protein
MYIQKIEMAGNVDVEMEEPRNNWYNTETITSCKETLYSCVKSCGVRGLSLTVCDGSTGICNCGNLKPSLKFCKIPRLPQDKQYCNPSLCKKTSGDQLSKTNNNKLVAVICSDVPTDVHRYCSCFNG